MVKLDIERIAKLETQMEDLKENVAAVKEDVKEVHSRITTTTREIVDKIDDMKQCIDNKLDQSSKKAESQRNEIKDSLEKDIEEVAVRVDAIEKWRYMVIGAAIVIGYLIGAYKFSGWQ
jgi:predicted  nucleic acid-binding Zn-ribbon protein